MSIVRVAQLAGLSKSTVSLVINNSPAVSPATVAKVRDAMQQLGYEPGPREFRKGPKPNHKQTPVSLTLALLTLGIPNAVLRAPIYNDVLHGVATRIAELRHRFLVYHAPEAGDFEAENAAHNEVDGFLLFGQGESAEAAHTLRKFPCVSLMGAERLRDWGDQVSYDDVAVGRLAATHLLAKGHKHLAYLGIGGWQRGKCFAAAIREAGASVEILEAEGLITMRDDLNEVNPLAFTALVDRLTNLSPRPTGLFVWSDMLTAALYPYLYNQGMHPGRDLDMVSCNNEWPILLGLQPKPAVIDIQGVKVGQRAVDQLLLRIQQPRESRVTIVLDPTLIP